MTQSTAHQPDKKTSNKIEPSQVLAAVVSGLLAGVIAVSLEISLDALKQMEQDDSGMAFAFHQGIIRLISERLTNLINTVDALQQ